MDATRHVIGPAEGEQFLNLGSHVVIKLAAEATGGEVAVLEHVVPPQGGPPPHTHPETEILYILSGTFEVLVGPERTEAGVGSVIYVPPGAVHTTRNTGGGAGRQLSIYLPGGAEGFFREAGTPVTGRQMLPDLDRPADLSGVDIPRIVAIAERYGMKVSPGPPPGGGVSAADTDSG